MIMSADLDLLVGMEVDRFLDALGVSNIGATGGFCITPLMRNNNDISAPKRCEKCIRSLSADPCPAGLVCTRNNPNAYKTVIHTQVVMPGCLATEVSHLNVDDYYCTTPAVFKGPIGSKTMGRHCEAGCTLDKDCLPGLVYQQWDGDELIRGCWIARPKCVLAKEAKSSVTKFIIDHFGDTQVGISVQSSLYQQQAGYLLLIKKQCSIHAKEHRLILSVDQVRPK